MKSETLPFTAVRPKPIEAIFGLRIDDIEANPAYANSGLSVYSISISIDSEELKKYKTHTEIIEALRSLDYIYHIEEMSL